MTTDAAHDPRLERYLDYVRKDGLPRYAHPPVTHVSLGFHFQGFAVRAVDLGHVHDRFRRDYPVVEEAGPVPNQIEFFGEQQAPHVQFQFLDRPPIPMVTFLDERRGRLVQVQSDRFSCAWRKVPGDERYPDYLQLRREFVLNALTFERYSDSLGEDLPNLMLVQAEITYVNDIPLAGRTGWEVARATLRSGPQATTAAGALPAPDEFKMAQVHTFNNRLGVPSARLHVASETVWTEMGPVYRISLTYRGQPAERFPGNPEAVETMLAFYDEGHETIVTAFSEVTSLEMHQVWGRES